MYCSDKYQRGFTIVELFVGALIMSILVFFVFGFFSTQTAFLQRSRVDSEMQQELRWGMDYILRQVRLAGNGVPATSGWQVLKNSNGVGGAPDTLSVMGAFTSSVINTEQPMGNRGSPVKVDNTQGMYIGDLVVVSDGTYREIFLVTNINDNHLFHGASPPWNPTNQLNHRYKENSTVIVIEYNRFYVAPDENGVPSLMVKAVSQPEQVLIGDVEDFQIRFKLKNGNWVDESPNVYDINMVEITIKTRSPHQINGYLDPDHGDSYRRMELKNNVIPKNIAIM